MASFYHGSRVRYLVEGGTFHLRQALKSFRRNRRMAAGDPELAAAEKAFETAIGRRNWLAVRKQAAAIAEIARKRNSAELLQKMAQAFERLGDFAKASDLRIAARRIVKGAEPDAWRGEDIGEKSLLIHLVEDDPRSLGKVIRHARLAGDAARRAKRTTVRVEARMAPILERTFPGIEVVPADAETLPKADVVATFDHLAAVFARDADELARSFVPLSAADEAKAEFRKRYAEAGAGPLIGLSWGSKSHSKDVPDFPDWAGFLARLPATFVSLQYGKIDPALRRLQQGHERPIIQDETVDQMVDMNRFAAQVAALDAVVSISNTAAHLAGALGVPSVFIVDDKFHTAWPVIGDRTPWYPRGVVIRKEGRAWPAVLDEAEARLRQMLPALGRAASGR
jgi:hypothetical protein